MKQSNTLRLNGIVQAAVAVGYASGYAGPGLRFKSNRARKIYTVAAGLLSAGSLAASYAQKKVEAHTDEHQEKIVSALDDVTKTIEKLKRNSKDLRTGMLAQNTNTREALQLAQSMFVNAPWNEEMATAMAADLKDNPELLRRLLLGDTEAE